MLSDTPKSGVKVTEKFPRKAFVAGKRRVRIFLGPASNLAGAVLEFPRDLGPSKMEVALALVFLVGLV